MRTCVSCGDPIPDKKRKDAKYCDKAGCRGREYRKRQAEAQASEGKPHTHAASTVLACACGRRYKIQICALDEPESRPEPAQSAAPPQVITETVLPTAQSTTEQDTGPGVQAATSRAVTQSVLLTDLRQTEPAAVTSPARGLEALTQTVRTDVVPPDFVTLEMYFTRGTERRIPFGQATYRQSDGRWALQPQAQAVFSAGDANRPSLGGRPGGWSRFYGRRSPTLFGFDADLVVMFWDQAGRRGRVVSANLLRDILGDGWKAKLRELAEEKQRTAAG